MIDEIAPIKEVRVKSNSQDWFDAEINEEIERWDKLLTKFKKSRSHSDNQNYKKSRNKVQRFNEQEIYILGDLNINLINSQKHIPNGIKRYKEFCSLHGIEKLLTLPNPITNNSSFLLDHILTNTADRISQFGIVNVGLSDHQLIYCTRKITRTRLNTHKYVKMRSLKYYSEDLYVKKLKLKKLTFPITRILKTLMKPIRILLGKLPQ